MAIKVNGTTVIDDSRNFTNIAGGFKTVNGTSVVGSGDISAGASTSQGAVGTYTWGRPADTSNYGPNSTVSGLYSASYLANAAPYRSGSNWYNYGNLTALSGTWRTMNGAGADGYGSAGLGLWVRIS